MVTINNITNLHNLKASYVYNGVLKSGVIKQYGYSLYT